MHKDGHLRGRRHQRRDDGKRYRAENSHGGGRGGRGGGGGRGVEMTSIGEVEFIKEYIMGYK